MAEAKDYRAIVLWGKQLGSYSYYIEREQAKAAADNAPIDALYSRGEGDWVCVSDLKEGHPFREDYVRMLKGKGAAS